MAADVRAAPLVMVTARSWPEPVPAGATQVAVVCAVVTVADSHVTPPRVIVICEAPRGPKDVPVTVIVPPAVVSPAAGSMADTAGASTESSPAPVVPDVRVPSYIATVTSVLMGRPSAIVHVISVSSTVTLGPVQGGPAVLVHGVHIDEAAAPAPRSYFFFAVPAAM